MNVKGMCPMKDQALDLLHCESESDVDKVLKKFHSDEWVPLDRRESNFNVVTNQAASGPKALAELCTNMVDAILLRLAEERGIKPRGSDAPRSVVEAVKILVRLEGARSGILAEADDHKYLREYAEKNLVIGVTGTVSSGSKPCFTFIDSGEGQAPENFEKTFLSLSSGRKKDIPFVQGKYNMGSSGVLSYCGRKWYKLIISRRFDRKSPWGWTIIRRRPGGGAPIAEYLKIEDKIPCFESDKILPFVRRDGKVDTEIVRHTGTIVKLYSYEFGTSANFRTIREALNENLVSTVLPFRLMDYRNKPDKKRGGRRKFGIDERTVCGMDFQLRRIDDPEADDSDEPCGDPIHVGNIQHPDLGTLKIQAVPLPRELPGWLAARRNSFRVYHSVNGQVQYKQGRGFLSQACKLPGLKDRVVILVDASDMTEAAHNDVWKGDREVIRKTEVGNLYEASVKDAIRKSQPLKSLEKRLAEEETRHLARETASSLFEDVVAADPHIAQLLPGGAEIRLKSPRTSNERQEEIKPFEGKYSPTFLTLVGRSLRKNGIDVPQKGDRRVMFRTDARNDWLTRPDNRGEVALEGDARFKISVEASLYDGVLNLVLRALVGTEAGDIVQGNVTLCDDAMPHKLSEPVRIYIVSDRPKKLRGPETQSNSDEEGAVDRKSAVKGLPSTQWMTRDGRCIGDEQTEVWPDHFDDQDGGEVQSLAEDKKLYRINYDNAHFQHFLREERSDVQRKVIVEQYRLSMLVLMLGFEHAYSKLGESHETEALEEHSDQFRRIVARGAATVVMSIARTLPQMVNPSTVRDPDDV